MLLYFKVKNYTCFAEEVCLSFIPQTSIDDHPTTLNKTNDIISVLPVIGILGSNASGKSQILNAFFR